MPNERAEGYCRLAWTWRVSSEKESRLTGYRAPLEQSRAEQERVAVPLITAAVYP